MRLRGPVGELEARWLPAVGDDPRVAIVCHPHPQGGGTMDNKVVTTITRALHLHGLGVLRFNFRGVGASEGEFGDGVGEADDLAAVVAHLRATGTERIWLAGFSFGAGISIGTAVAAGAEGLISIAPPVQRFDLAEAQTPRCPWLIVQGDADELVDAAEVAAWVNDLVVTPDLIHLPGVDHFFHGNLTLLRDTLSRWLEAGDDRETE